MDLSKLRLGLRVASAILDRMPVAGDGFLPNMVRCLAMADSVYSTLNPGKENGVSAVIDRYDLLTTTNPQFVDLFFETKLKDEFKVDTFNISDHMRGTEAVSSKYGRLFFVEYTYGDGKKEPTFYHSKGFLFEDVLTQMWDTYEGHIHVSISNNMMGAVTNRFTSFRPPHNPLYGKARGLIESKVARHRRKVAQKVPQAYMFVGPPGTGKTSIAMEFASRLGGRILKVDASTLSHCELHSMVFLLDGLKPEFLLIDDLDKSDLSKVVPTVLDLLQKFRIDYPEMTVILTANSTESFDPGLLRPGRIDNWIEFVAPDEAEREEVLRRYLTCEVSDEDISSVVLATEGLTQDYLRDIAQRMEEEPIEEVLQDIDLKKRLLKATKDADEDEDDEVPEGFDDQT